MNALRWTILIAGALAAAACGKPADSAEGPDLPAREVRVAGMDAEVPAADPFSPAWDGAREMIVPMLAQDVAEPRLTGKGAETVRLRALSDGRRIAFRLEWEDEAPEDLVDTDRSTDAVALQFPATGGGEALPDSMMGEEGKPVAITLWRAAWQRRADGGTHGIEALYPYATSDHYPPEAAKDPDVRRKMELLYDPPAAVGNPVAAKTIASAVEDLEAEGFGTLAHRKEQVSAGKGVHRDGRWHVVISRPLDLSPGSATAIRPGTNGFLAVAVWDGGKNQRGSMKMRSVWVPLVFEEVAP